MCFSCSSGLKPCGPFVKYCEDLANFKVSLSRDNTYQLIGETLRLCKFRFISCWARRETLDSFQRNEIKALEKHECRSTDSWDRSDQCLLHQRFGLDLLIPRIDLSCFASGHLYNTVAVFWLSRGRSYESLMYKLMLERWAGKGQLLRFCVCVLSERALRPVTARLRSWTFPELVCLTQLSFRIK